MHNRINKAVVNPGPVSACDIVDRDDRPAVTRVFELGPGTGRDDRVDSGPDTAEDRPDHCVVGDDRDRTAVGGTGDRIECPAGTRDHSGLSLDPRCRVDASPACDDLFLDLSGPGPIITIIESRIDFGFQATGIGDGTSSLDSAMQRARDNP